MVAAAPAVHQQQLADRLVPGCISISAANPVISVGYTLANFQLYATANRIAMPPRAVEPVKPTVIDNYLVQISSAESPNSFYIVREVDMPARQQLHHKLNGEAVNFKVPQSVVPFSLYAVCKTNGEWCRGLAGKSNQQAEKLKFLLVDSGEKVIFWLFYLVKKGIF